jgi:hypothetical protein
MAVWPLVLRSLCTSLLSMVQFPITLYINQSIALTRQRRLTANISVKNTRTR